MSNKDNGGSAFPETGWNDENGMSLRDYFAAKAMQVLLHSFSEEGYVRYEDGAIVEKTKLSEMSYDIADAMIKESQK